MLVCSHWSITQKHSYLYILSTFTLKLKALPVLNVTHMGKALSVSHEPEALVLDTPAHVEHTVSQVFNHSLWPLSCLLP